MDKRSGKKQVWERTDTREVGLPSFSLKEAIEYVIVVKQSKNLKDRTISDYAKVMQYFIDWTEERYGEMSIRQITIKILREYILWCLNEKNFYGGHPFKDQSEGIKGISPTSVNVRIRVLKTFFKVLYEEEIITSNPTRNLSLMRQDKDTVQPLTDNELQRLLKAPDQKSFAQFRDYVIMITIVDTGIRINEICSLNKNQVDLMRKRITITADKSKNRKSRILPMSTMTARLLKKLIDESKAYFQSTLVFTTNYGESLSDKTIQKAFTKYADKAKIQRQVSPHVLRHNFATMAANNGMSVFHLMEILGHADIETTRKYVQVSDTDVFQQHNLYSPLKRLIKRT